MSNVKEEVIKIIKDSHEVIQIYINNNNFNNIDISYIIHINKLIREVVKARYKYGYTFHEELMQYFYNPSRVNEFLLNNDNKHVEDMYS